MPFEKQLTRHLFGSPINKNQKPIHTSHQEFGKTGIETFSKLKRNSPQNTKSTKGGTLYKMGRPGYASFKGLRRTGKGSLKKSGKNFKFENKVKKPAICRKTIFYDTNPFDPVYYPNYGYVKNRTGRLCMAFNKMTKRSDHNFLGISSKSSEKQIPAILDSLKFTKATKK